MKIHEVAEKTGLAGSAIRFYEKAGLIPEQLITRGANGYRNYTPEIFPRLNEIGKMKSAGLDLNQIRKILSEQNYGCDELKSDLEAKIRHIQKTVAEFNLLLTSLTALKHECETKCQQNNPKDCCS